MSLYLSVPACHRSYSSIKYVFMFVYLRIFCLPFTIFHYVQMFECIAQSKMCMCIPLYTRLYVSLSVCACVYVSACRGRCSSAFFASSSPAARHHARIWHHPARPCVLRPRYQSRLKMPTCASPPPPRPPSPPVSCSPAHLK